MRPEDFAGDLLCTQVATRLAAQFSAMLSRKVVTATVLRARADLHGQVVPEALGEMLHRLAHHRLGVLCVPARAT
ncbi:hypothetical protein ABZ816_25830 [Actinosynnema sp. NPDC047251]|uniref:Uncharacterized protein n=1 Tax=Saccharothrix espanaensis (strain ATCC 51144 / DSM 44229 / JCM 9112 / NBRC 15066 / NRRL 15764) TaxID=1179773 RepID=K0K2L1_SACES|nr:hypothetical protein [Saccharothrix espanaensis]CCH31827.1 hypothetical protein BN6_45470 [Saccharothrix espanaensis DSM 44229]